MNPWDKEPDRLEWKYKGFDCLIVRSPDLRHLCGYVGLKPGHPFFEKHYDEIPVDVHGGLTYSNQCNGHICHTTDDPNDHTWWIGFDCAHAGDLIPGLTELRKQMSKTLQTFRAEEHYWTIEEVKKETEYLADQVIMHERRKKISNPHNND